MCLKHIINLSGILFFFLLFLSSCPEVDFLLLSFAPGRLTCSVFSAGRCRRFSIRVRSSRCSRLFRRLGSIWSLSNGSGKFTVTLNVNTVVRKTLLSRLVFFCPVILFRFILLYITYYLLLGFSSLWLEC